MGASSSTIIPSAASSNQPTSEDIRTLTGSRNDEPWPQTADGLHRQLKYLSGKWRKTQCRKELLRVLDSQQPEGGWSFTRAIGFAFGSFTMEGEIVDHDCTCEHSLLQFAVFLDLAEHLRSNGGIDIVVQDPEFTELDMTLLRRSGVTILRDPKAQRMMGPEAFGFAVHWGGEGELFAQCQHLQPGLFIGLRTKFLIERDEWNEQWARRTLAKTRRSEKPAIRHVLAQHAERRALLRQFREQHVEIPVPPLKWRRCLVWGELVIHLPIRRSADMLPAESCDACGHGGRNEFRDDCAYQDLEQTYGWAEEFNSTGRMPRYLAEQHRLGRIYANYHWHSPVMLHRHGVHAADDGTMIFTQPCLDVL